MAKITSKTEEEKQNAKEEYSARKKELRKLIRQSKKECWNNLCEELNKDIWGQGYKIAIKGLRNLAPYEITDKQKKDIVKQLFPCPNNQKKNDISKSSLPKLLNKNTQKTDRYKKHRCLQKQN